jgi:hypothetical protein
MSGPAYITPEEAITRTGLRLVLTQGVPGPWSVAGRALFDIKRIRYTLVAQLLGTPNEALQQWTGQSSAPVAVLDEERPSSPSPCRNH